MFIPGVLGHSLTPALWFDIAGAALLSAANPPLDAARLDIMPAPLWGRAESTRTVARSLAQALAPIVFGLMADLINGAHLEEAPIGTHPLHHVTQHSAVGLQYTFLIMLATLGAAGWFMLRARHTYAGEPLEVLRSVTRAHVRPRTPATPRRPRYRRRRCGARAA